MICEIYASFPLFLLYEFYGMQLLDAFRSHFRVWQQDLQSGPKSDTSRTLHYSVREVSLFWPTLYVENYGAREMTSINQSLADVNSRSRSLYAVADPSVVCLSVVCLWRWCTLLRPLNFSAIFSPYYSPGTLLFWCQKSLVGDAPFPLKSSFKVTDPPFK